jgi:hypothetical protein
LGSIELCCTLETEIRNIVDAFKPLFGVACSFYDSQAFDLIDLSFAASTAFHCTALTAATSLMLLTQVYEAGLNRFQ